MKKNIPFLFLLLIIIIQSCNWGNDRQSIAKRDKSITAVNSYTGLFFDSTDLENYITSHKIADTTANYFRSFYNGRNFQYAWFSNDGLTEQAYNFWSLQSNYIDYSGDSSIYNAALQHLMDTLGQPGNEKNITDEMRLKSELQFTQQFFTYTSKAYEGDDSIKPSDIQWFIPREKINMMAFLDSLLANKGKQVANYEPVNPQYHKLKQALLQYYDINKKGGFPVIQLSANKLEPGEKDAAIMKVKKYLTITGDYTAKDTSSLFTDSLKIAVLKFQNRFGLKEDGSIGTSMVAAMNKPIQDRIQQLLINMERMRWVPTAPPSNYILVNIPNFKLTVYENSKPAFSMNVVVGSTQHNTVIFSGTLKYVVFSPYWNVPTSIVKKELMSGINRGGGAYLARRNMEVVTHSGSVPIVRQKPGPGNALGKVKFLFPNSYNIYLHDTPSKSLFGETRRAFSHGCIRLGEPVKLAEYLLRNDTAWTPEKIKTAMNSGREKYVTLKDNETLPVYIGYFTAYFDNEGNLNFRDDIYGHDAKMAQKMFRPNSMLALKNK